MGSFALNAKKIFFVFILTFIFWLGLQAITPVHAENFESSPQTLLIKFSSDTSSAERMEIVAEIGGEIDQWMEQIFTARVTISAASSRIYSNRILQNRSVVRVENDVFVAGSPIVEQYGPAFYGNSFYGNSTIPASPVQVNDPDFNNPQKVYAPQIVELPLAWFYEMGDSETVVAILDSGIDSNHPDLKDRILTEKGYDFVNDDNDPADDHGHGTHVAGIVAAVANNNIGSAGVCPNCSLMAVKVLDHNNVGSWSDVVSGILYAVDNGANVINLSLGGSSNIRAVEDAISYAIKNNVVVVAAAGNGRTNTPFYPAALDDVIGVSASRNDDTRWSLSNFGTENVDVAAPGYAIFSTYNDQNNYYNGYMYMSGTSMAAPHVAGLAALLISQDPSRTVSEIQELIASTADDLGDPGKDQYFGAGRINAYRAVSAGLPQPKANAGAGGVVWSDENGNGVREEDERAASAPIIVRLEDRNGVVIGETLPAESGAWQMENLFPGSYVVRAISSDDIVFTSPDEYQIRLSEGEQRTDLHFGAADTETAEFAFQVFVPSLSKQR